MRTFGDVLRQQNLFVKSSLNLGSAANMTAAMSHPSGAERPAPLRLSAPNSSREDPSEILGRKRQAEEDRLQAGRRKRRQVQARSLSAVFHRG